MSKKEDLGKIAKISWGSAYVISNKSPDVICGKVYGIIEAAGLNPKQEEAIKGLIQNAVWKVFEDAVYITSERHDEIKKAYFESRNNSDGPVGAV